MIVRIFLTISIFISLQYSSVGQSLIAEFSKLRAPSSDDTLDIELFKPSIHITGSSFYDKNILKVAREGNTVVTTIQYQIDGATSLLIGDGSGHEIFVFPGDTVKAFWEHSSTEENFLKDNLPSPWTSRLHFSGTFGPEHGFFDSIAYVDEAVHKDHLLYYKGSTVSPDSFFNRITLQFINRMDFLGQYETSHRLRPEMRQMAKGEIEFAYWTKLLEIFPFSQDSIKLKIRRILDTVDKENEYLYFHSLLYPGFVYRYTMLFDSDGKERPKLQYDLLSLFTYFREIRQERIRDHLLMDVFRKYSSVPGMEFDSLYNLYKTKCIDPSYISFIDSLAGRRRSLDLRSAYKSLVIGEDGKLVDFQTILRGKPTVIDCWATWCVPCLRQRKSIEQYAKLFNGRLDFISLSLDKNKESWKKKIIDQKNPYIREFWLKDGYSSDFFDFFKIGSIPRYILLDNKAKVIEFIGATPEDRKEFESQLERLSAL